MRLTFSIPFRTPPTSTTIVITTTMKCHGTLPKWPVAWGEIDLCLHPHHNSRQRAKQVTEHPAYDNRITDRDSQRTDQRGWRQEVPRSLLPALQRIAVRTDGSVPVGLRMQNSPTALPYRIER